MAWIGDDVRRMVMLALVAVPGCTDRVAPVTIGSGNGDDAGDDAATTDGDGDDDGVEDTGGEDAPATTTSGDDGPMTTTPPTTLSTSGDDGSSGDDAPIVPTCVDPGDWGTYELCVGEPDEQGSCECGPECQQATVNLYYQTDCCGSCDVMFSGVQCSEVREGQCCFLTSIEEDIDTCGKGRPFTVQGRARIAAQQTGLGWTTQTPLPALDALDAAQRMDLHAYWLEAAMAEHASVASFARFVMQLLALGAPAELVSDAQQAIGDEVEHAKIAFTLAAHYGGTAVAPGKFDLAGGLEHAQDVREILASVIAEGCVGETIAATEIAVAAANASDPAVRRALATIADDESRHAALAWKTVRWIVEHDPSLGAFARGVFASAIERQRGDLRVREDVGVPCREHGNPGGRYLAQVAQRCIDETIEPAIALAVDPAARTAAVA